MLPKCFFFLQLRMCFALFQNYKIPFINAAMAIETIVSVKQFLRNFPTTLSKCSMFTFIIIKLITKFGFRFPNEGDYKRGPQSLHFIRKRTFQESHVKGLLRILIVSCCKDRNSTYRVRPNKFFSHMVHIFRSCLDCFD